MEDLILNGEYYYEQREKIFKANGGAHHYHGVKDNIGEAIILAYSNDNPEWTFTFLLIGVSVSKKLDLYRLIYKYTGS